MCLRVVRPMPQTQIKKGNGKKTAGGLKNFSQGGHDVV